MRKTLAIMVILLVAVDQVSKYFASIHLPFHEAVEVIPFFSLYLTHNTGVAFSMLSWLGSGGLIAMTLVILGILIVLWRKLPRDQQLASVGFALVISGAVGNLIDRVSLGYVVDFFLLHTETWAFAVFNGADSFITLGAIAIIIEEVFAFKRKAAPSDRDQ